MGTTADKLQAVLDSKNAIKEKFGLSDDLPFSQYANSINPQGGGAPEFYKCASLQHATLVPENTYSLYKAIWVHHGTGIAEDYDGLYILTTPDLEGTARKWHHFEKDYDIEFADGVWGIFDSEGTKLLDVGTGTFPLVLGVESEDTEGGYEVGSLRVVWYPYFQKIYTDGFAHADVAPNNSFWADGNIPIVYDLSGSAYGYYWDIEECSGQTYNNWFRHVEFMDGKWWYYDNKSKGRYVYTDEEMPFKQDGSTVQWRNTAGNVAGSATCSKRLQGLWDYNVIVVENIPNYSKDTHGKYYGNYYRNADGNYYNEYGSAFMIGIQQEIYLDAVVTEYRDEDGDGEEEAYDVLVFDRRIATIGTDWSFSAAPENTQAIGISLGDDRVFRHYYKIITWSYCPDPENAPDDWVEVEALDLREGSTSWAIATIRYGMYRPLPKASQLRFNYGTETLFFDSDDGENFYCGTKHLRYRSYDIISADSKYENAKTWVITENGSVFDYMPLVELNINFTGTENYASSDQFPWRIAMSGGAPTYNYNVGFMYFEKPFCRAAEGVAVEGCGLDSVNGWYFKTDRLMNDFPVYVHRVDESSSVYLMNVDNCWLFSAASTGSSPIAQQTETNADLTSSHAPYRMTTATGELSEGVTEIVVRYAIEGERGSYYNGADAWTGYKANLVDGEYSFASSATANLPYAEQGFYPAIGNTYSKDLKIQVEQLYGTELGKYFLCSYVNRNYLSYNTIVVSGMPTTPFAGATYYDYDSGESGTLSDEIGNRNPNGTYTLTNPDEKYPSNYIWKSENGCLLKTSPWGMGFVIYPDDYNEVSKYLQYSDDTGMGSEYPVPDDYTSYKWSYYDGNTTTALAEAKVFLPEPPPVEQYWEGYQLIQSKDGKYDISGELTRLTYGDFMPVAGRFYDAACSMEITNVDLTDDALWSCPRNMVSAENDEWVITTNGTPYSGREAYMAFDGNGDTVCQVRLDGVSVYLQWQNKNRPATIKKMYAHPGGADLSGTFKLEGSDDGENWTQVWSGGWEYVSTLWIDGLEFNRAISIPKNGGVFRYHRLTCVGTSSYITLHNFAAFSQLDREVPK